MGLMIRALLEKKKKKSIKSHISSIKANLTPKTRYVPEKVHWKNRIAHLFQISWPGINNKFKLVKVPAPHKLN